MYPIRQYKQELEKIIQFGGSRNESSIRRAFAALLNHYAAAQNLILVEELSVKTTKGNAIRFDGVLKDTLRSDWSFWEAKLTIDVSLSGINKEIIVNKYDFELHTVLYRKKGTHLWHKLSNLRLIQVLPKLAHQM